MASYNHAKYLREAVESVWTQSYPNIEFVVVDDASADGSAELLKSLLENSPIPMRVEFNEKNRGPAFTIGRAFELSKGEFIAFLASDDVYAPSRFESQLRSFADDPQLLISFAEGIVLDGRGEKGAPIHGEKIRNLLNSPPCEILTYLYTHVSPLHLQCALVRKSALLSGHAFDKSAMADDWLTNIRIFEQLAQAGHCAFVDQIVCHYRVHGENLHKNHNRYIRLVKQMINAYIPPKFRRTARANIYWDIGLSLAQQQPLRAVSYMLISQFNRFRPWVAMRLLKSLWLKIWR